jgi:flagellar basal-body rod modification protein FlgD
MASISSISSVSYSQAGDTTGAGSPSRVPQKALGQDDFLKLLAVQFQVQDPMKPMEDTAFIAQMAQFSALEQSSAISRDMSAMRADQQRTAANSYLGQHVTLDAGNGAVTTGAVSAVDVSGSEPKLIVGSETYSLSAVLRVESGLVPAPVVVTPPQTGGA